MRRKIPVFVSLTFLMVSCGLNPFNSDKPDPDDRYFQIKVDSVAVASPLRVFDPFQGGFGRLVGTASPLSVVDTMRVLFYGGIGPGLCHGFSHFDTTRIDLVGYKVSVWGRHSGGTICPGEVSELAPNLGGDILEFYPPLRVGTWIFLVSQPDGSVLRKEAVVRG